MKYLFSAAGAKALEKVATDQSLLAFDFDGTLAPITESPSRARVPKASQALLDRLARLYPVAVLSGRGQTDLTGRLPPGLHSYIGNHGLEGLRSSDRLYARAERICADWHFRLTGLLASHGLDDIYLENKRYSLSLHYRQSRHPRLRRRDLLAFCALLDPPPRLIPGKFVINLVPPRLPNKGDALKHLIRASQARTAIYVGDDDTDEDVFRLHLPRVLSICVGRRRNSHADFYLRDQREIRRLLRTLVELRRRSSSGNVRTA
jgi:trehalose 6-phosphate phosphatase